MSIKLNKDSYQELIEQNIEWLNKQPQTLEREHIKKIVLDSINFYYPKQGQTLHLDSVSKRCRCKEPIMIYKKDEAPICSDCGGLEQ